MRLQKNYSLQDLINEYENEESCNDSVFNHFTDQTNQNELLKSHRDHIEAFNLGYGDRAFHFMWSLIITHIQKNQLPLSVLEIGVFKGQIISLWKLLSMQLNIDLKITGITPLEGKKRPNAFISYFLYKFSKGFRKEVNAGNFYGEIDYVKTINELFSKFDLDFSSINLLKGYSTDPAIIQKVKDQKFSVIYIDGDHTFETVVHDIKTYSGLVYQKGFLVMDDASYNIPGTVFWKGYESVANACEIIEDLGFKNVLNVGHNRVYQKL